MVVAGPIGRSRDAAGWRLVWRIATAGGGFTLSDLRADLRARETAIARQYTGRRPVFAATTQTPATRPWSGQGWGRASHMWIGASRRENPAEWANGGFSPFYRFLGISGFPQSVISR